MAPDVVVRKHRGQPELDAIDFLALIRDKARLVEMDEKFWNQFWAWT